MKQETTKKGQGRRGHPDKWASVKALQDAIDAYFLEADQKGEPYLITGLCLALGCSRECLLEWDKNTGKYPKPEKAIEAIKRAKMKCQNWTERAMMTGKVNPVAGIFNLKNNYKWKDKTEVDATSNGKELQAVPIVINMPKGDE